MKKKYDFILCGYGLSSSVILYKMSKINYYLDKKILIIESNVEDVNKTWCFWDNNDSKWSNFLSKKWSEVNFKSSDVSLDFKLNDMTYNMIKSQDFLKL